MSAKRRVLDRPRELAPALFGFLLVIGLVLAEKDLGTALVIAAIFFAVLWVVGIQLRLLLLLIVAGVLGLGAMVIGSPNRMARIFSFLGQGNDRGGVPAAAEFDLRDRLRRVVGSWSGRVAPEVGGARRRRPERLRVRRAG